MHTRYAIKLTPNTGNHIWYCQGAPKDPSNFGFAILYATVAHARKAMSKAPGWFVRQNAELVEVQCFLGSPVEID